MMHTGEILFAAKLSGAHEIILIGDTNQIPYINRSEHLEVSTHRITEVAETTKELNISHRCTRSTTALLSPYYTQGMLTTSYIKNDLKFQIFDSLDNLSHTIDKKKHTCLVFKQSQKREICKRGYTASTIHKFQGRQAENIVLTTKSFLYITPIRDDTISTWLQRANSLHSQELLKLFKNTATDKQHNKSTHGQSNDHQNQTGQHSFLAERQQPREKHKQHINIQENQITSTRKEMKLTLAYQNINWISNKIDRLTHFLQNEEPDLVIITEHGLSQDNLRNTCIEGYTLIGSIARKNRVKGGVAGYAKKDMEHQVKLLYTSGDETELICETALFEIKLTRQTILVLGVYRAPSANLEQAIDILTEQLERALEMQDKPIVLMGDINMDNLIKDNASEKIDDFRTIFNIVRMSLPLTRVTKDTVKSIDWICTNIDPN
ncbi:hypothetical protein J6590_072835 [Homalodisca vitripennis]|nr:hypothetical protein J6590_072835 [Homalodisca vitripennis]